MQVKLSIPRIIIRLFQTDPAEVQTEQPQTILINALNKSGVENNEVPIQRVSTPKEACEQLIEALVRLIDIAEANFVEGIMEFEQNRAIELSKSIKQGLVKSSSYNEVHIQLLERYLFVLRNEELRRPGSSVTWADAIRGGVRYFAEACKEYIRVVRHTPMVDRIYRDSSSTRALYSDGSNTVLPCV